MKKNTIKAFTLVEMLIVIVIIGILIASLMPRMQSAQWRARDVARKNDLSQIQTAVITSQADRGARPGMTNNAWQDETCDGTSTTGANGWLMIKEIACNLQKAWMTQVPTDPNGSNVTKWLGGSTKDYSGGQYTYLVAKRNWVNNAWFALMAKTEVEWSSNWVVCTSWGTSTGQWYLTSSDDLAHITLCSQITKGSPCVSNKRECVYEETAELRYLLVY
jgi:prepilin-type N-terminal cleavage/methylation domain-containing protein